jgi:hypothetical protein
VGVDPQKTAHGRTRPHTTAHDRTQPHTTAHGAQGPHKNHTRSAHKKKCRTPEEMSLTNFGNFNGCTRVENSPVGYPGTCRT